MPAPSRLFCLFTAAESLRHLRCVQLRTNNSYPQELIYSHLAQVSHGYIQLLLPAPPFRIAVEISAIRLRRIRPPVLKLHTLLAGTWQCGATLYKDSIRFAARASGAVLGKS